MITAIEKIYGVGRYGRFDGPVDIHKNQVVFGFNGAGKSTLSDIFYSLKNDEEHLEHLYQRKTLTTESGERTEAQSVVFTTDDEPLIFNEGKWNKKINIHVFNDQYIDEYLFIGDSYQNGTRPIGLGSKETRNLILIQECEKKLHEHLDYINQVIANNKETCCKAGLGKNKISNIKWKKRVVEFANLGKIRQSKKEAICELHNNPSCSDPNIEHLQLWINTLEELHILLDVNGAKVIRKIPSLLLSTPEVTGSEIVSHMEEVMCISNPEWLARGRKYQKDENICPYCGQEITSHDFSKLARELDSFLNSKQQQKTIKIRQSVQKTKYYFSEEQIESFQQMLSEICDSNEGKSFLTKWTLNLVKSLRFSDDISIATIRSLIKKIELKSQNLYEKIEMTQEEIKLCSLMENILKKIRLLSAKLKQELNRNKEKLHTDKTYESQEGLYEIFYGDNKEIFQTAINFATEIIELDNKIKAAQKELGNMLDEHKLQDVNTFLEEVNVNFSVSIIDNAYQVKIRGYESSDYKKDNKILCSEGERRMLAFAYFLQEIAEDQENKIIVVDDPVSSMDSSRRSVVAYKLMSLMQDEKNQVIVLSHDLFFVERLKVLSEKLKDNPLKLLQINKYGSIFTRLNLDEYIVTDEKVYEQIIQNGIDSNRKQDRVVAWIALRPYASIKTGESGVYHSLERKASYLSHSIYSNSKNIEYKEDDYTIEAMKEYCDAVNRATSKEFDADILCDTDLFNENGVFLGFDYSNIWELYEAIPMDSMLEIREKALVFRLVLEASLYMMRDSSKKLNLERIGSVYMRLKKQSETETKNKELKEKRKLCLSLCKLYEFSKKYHHGVDDGSSLGLSALNLEEMHQYDQEICKIHDWIVTHPKNNR